MPQERSIFEVTKDKKKKRLKILKGGFLKTWFKKRAQSRGGLLYFPGGENN